MYHDAFDTDVMDDLAYDAAEGPAERSPTYDSYEDEFENEFDAYADDGDDYITDEYDDSFEDDDDDEYEDEFGEEGFDVYDEYEADGYDEFDAFDAYEGDMVDAFEDALADALDAEDADEFFKRLRRIARKVVSGARKGVRAIGKVARTVAPIAKAIPLPQAQAIGRIASVAGRLMADGADEYEVLDAMIDMAEEYDAFDAAAPMIATAALRKTTPRLRRASKPARRSAVNAVSRSVKTLARRQGGSGARAAVRVARTVGRRPIPTRAIAPTVKKITPKLARKPASVRKLSRPLSPMRGRRSAMRPAMKSPAKSLPLRTFMRKPATGAASGQCPTCGETKQFRLRGPVTVTLRSHA